MATSAFALGTMTDAGAAKKKAPLCAGKTKKKAVKNIKTAYDHFLNGAKYPTAADKVDYIELLSGKELNDELLASFTASSEANAEAAASTNVAVLKVTCSGKKRAVVDFDLILGEGATEPSGLVTFPGAAVIADGKWKVTGDTLCNLQALGDPTLLETEPCATVVAGG